MAASLETLAIELLGLPLATRAKLAKQLIVSFDDDEPADLDDAVITVAQRRAKEMAEGKVQGIPADEVFRQLEQELQ